MSRIFLKDVYYHQNKEIKEYIDIFLETDIGILQAYGVGFDFVNKDILQATTRLYELDKLREKYGRFYIDEVRGTYDSNLYILISGKFILAIEYILNSNFEYSLQEIRIIEDIYSLNKTEFDDFKELDIVKLPELQ